MRYCIILCCMLILNSCSERVQTEKSLLLSTNMTGIMPSRLDIGDIQLDVNEIPAVVEIHNSSDKMLVVKKVHGPCSCFVGWDGDREIMPGESGHVVARFNKDKIESGPVIRLLHVYTDNPDYSDVTVEVSFNVLRSPEGEQLYQVAKELTAIRRELQDMQKEVKQFTTVKVMSPKPTVRSKVNTKVYNVGISDSPMLGEKTAPVTIAWYSDFHCSYCIREYLKIKKILKEYNSKVNAVFKHFPLSFHKKVKPFHAAAEFAKRQGGNESFWKMHDMIMANPRKLEIADLRGYAKKLGLDLEKFDALMANEADMNELLKPDIIEAQKCHVRGTPTILINGLKLANRSMEGYKKRIDAILSNPSKVVAAGPKIPVVKHE